MLAIAALMSAFTVAACGGSSTSTTATGTDTAHSLPTATAVMSWFPQPTDGGFWYADLHHLGSQYGVNLHVVAGGPNINGLTMVAGGSAQFAWAGADSAMVARYHGTPLVAVASYQANYFECVMYHPSPQIKTPADLGISGHLLAVSVGNVWWQWMQAKYPQLKSARIVQLAASDVAQWASNPNIAIECALTNEPYEASQLHKPYGVFWLRSLGYNPEYILYTTEQEIAQHPAVVKAVVEAARKGWQDYLADPSSVESYIAAQDPVYKNKALYNYAFQVTRTKLEPKDLSTLGCMSPNSWKQLDANLVAAKLIPATFNYQEMVSYRFVPAC